MKASADEPGEEKGERIKSYTVQLWPSDMQFLEDLAGERNESAGELRRRALRVGKLLVATETPPMKDGKYGKTYTPIELAQELANSIVVQAIQFSERQGISLATIPATFFTGLQNAIANGVASGLAASGGLRIIETKKEDVTPEEQESEEAEAKKAPLVRAATLRRQNFRNEKKI